MTNFDPKKSRHWHMLDGIAMMLATCPGYFTPGIGGTPENQRHDRAHAVLNGATRHIRRNRRALVSAAYSKYREYDRIYRGA